MKATYGLSVQSMRERNVQMTGGGGGGHYSSGFSLGQMAIVLAATVGGTVGSYILLSLLAKLVP